MSWRDFWRRRPRTAGAREVVLYTRSGCHLCDDAKRLLESRQARFGLEIREVDVDADAELRDQYDACVPVVEIGGQVRFRGRVNPVLLDRLLAAH